MHNIRSSMKLLKRIGIFLLLLVALFLIAGIFVPRTMRFERQITIQRPSQEVFDYVVLLKNQAQYSKWEQIDPNMKKTYWGTDGTVGFVSAWESTNDEAGVGEQEIVRILPGKRIDYALRFKVPMETTNKTHLRVVSKGARETDVYWGFEGDTPYPLNTLAWLFNMEEMVGNDFEYGLQRLKEILEKSE